MKIYIIRHGETALNVNGVIQGRLDEPLNQNGRDLAAVTGKNMRGLRFDRCISSPMKRAAETARIILKESGNDVPVEFDERLFEISAGSCEGKKISSMGEESVKFLKDPFGFAGFPEGETVSDVCRRTQEFLKELIAFDDGKTYLISTHGCALRAMINFLTPDPSDFWQGHVPYNCAVTVVEAVNGAARIEELDRIYYNRDLIVDHFAE